MGLGPQEAYASSALSLCCRPIVGQPTALKYLRRRGGGSQKKGRVSAYFECRWKTIACLVKVRGVAWLGLGRALVRVLVSVGDRVRVMGSRDDVLVLAFVLADQQRHLLLMQQRVVG
jgi:hypothetical protein